MTWFYKLLIVLLVSAISGSKLNLPRVLLPLFKSSPTNFTLKVTENGCYTWTLSRLDIIQIIPVNQNKNLKCSSEVILSTITKEFMRNTVIVLVEEVTTKEVLRCDVIVDVVSNLRVVTKTRQLFVEESPEIFEVRAYDDQDNEFSTLEGIEFNWIVSSGHNDLSRKNDVLRIINFKDSLYEIPPTIRDLDSRGLRGHMVLVEGVKTGTANVMVQLDQNEYKVVSPTTVQLNVIANLIIEPADTYILRGDVIYYKLLQVKNGKFVEVPLPSAQYSLQIEDGTTAKQFRPWVIEALAVGQTKLFLSDVNSKMSNLDDKTYLPSVTLNVVLPVYMNLVPLPHMSWLTVLHYPIAIVAELFTDNNHKIYIGPHVSIDIKIDQRFEVTETIKNGSYVYGYANEVATIPVKAMFNSVTTNDGVFVRFTPLHAQADLLVYEPLKINPPVIRIPWDSHVSPKLNYPLNATGGDGTYQWNVASTHVSIVTQTGTVKPRSIGHTEIIVSVPKNQALQTSAKIIIRPPQKLTIVRSAIEAEVGSPIFLAIALYYFEEVNGHQKHILFSDCTGFPFDIKIQNFDFYYNASSTIKTPPDACTVIGIIGRSAGSSVVSVSYLSDTASLKDTATVSAYEPLRIISPESLQSVLSVGSTRYIYFVGGPSRSSVGHHLTMDYDKKVISATETQDRIENERVYLVVCQAIGKGHISLQLTSRASFEELSVPVLYRVTVLCRHPKSVILSTEVSDTKAQSCPLMFRSNNVVLSDKPIMIKVTLKDEEGNIFDNATSLSYKWSLPSEDLGEIYYQGEIKLQEENRIKYSLPQYHYQIINPVKRTGNMDVTIKALHYNKEALKAVNVELEEKNLKLSNLQDTLTLILVNNVVVSPEYISIFNHPQNAAEFFISQGSGFFNVSSTVGKAAQLVYSESSKSVKVMPFLPGSFTLTVKDECLTSEPVSAQILIVTISSIYVDVVDKIEKGKSVEAILELKDSEGNFVTKKDLLNLKADLDSKIIAVTIGDEKKGTGIVCTIRGLEIGNANLVFHAGTGSSIIQSKPMRIQVYPPLKILPGNVTLIPGAVIQLTAKGGPQPDCFIEYSPGNSAVTVDNAGNVVGKAIGRGYVVGKATGFKANGKKVVYSTDTIYVNVVHLEGIRIKTPLVRIMSGAKMPAWVEGVPKEISPLVLASVQPSLLFKWDVSSPDLVQIFNIFEETGIKISDSDKVSMKVSAVKPGNVLLSVNVTVPHDVSAVEKKNVFIDSVNVEVFDKLQIQNYDAKSSLLIAPNIKHQLRTNKDKHARIAFKLVKEHNSGIELTNEGLITTSNTYGHAFMEFNSVEDNGQSDNEKVVVEVSPIQYMMLNVIPDFQIDLESPMSGLPKGAKLRFGISYHDNYGRKFFATKTNIKFQFNKIDKIRITQGDQENTLEMDLLDSGTTVLKVFDGDHTLISDYAKINTIPYIQPDKQLKFTVGDIICFHMLASVKDSDLCYWNSSDENALLIEKQNGLGIAKSKQSNVIVSYHCPDNLKAITTAEIHSLQKVEVAKNKILSICNNGKQFIIPLWLLNEEDDEINLIRKNRLLEDFHCDIKDSAIYFPYECEIKFENDDTSYDISTVFKVHPQFDTVNGHSCVIDSENVTSQILSRIDTNILLKVHWGRYQSTVSLLPFRPAIYVDNINLLITDKQPADFIQIIGLPSVLAEVQVLLSDSHFIGLTEEATDNKNTLKYSIYLKSAYFKESCTSPPELNAEIISKVTEQHIKIPININVNVDYYVTPNYLVEEAHYYLHNYAMKVLATIVIGFILYFGISRIYRKIFDGPKDDSMHSMNLSHNRSGFSDHSSPLHYRYQKSPYKYNEIQMMYGRSSDRNAMNR